MKNFKILIVLLFLLTSTSCLSKNINTNIASNSFDKINDKNTTVMAEYGHSPYDFPKDYIYYHHGGFMNIPYVFYGGSVDSEVGLFVFINGVVQPYSIDNLEEAPYEYMKTFNIDANSEKVYTLNIRTTIGKQNDTLKLNFACVEFPSLGTIDESKLHLQNMSASISWKLSYLKDASNSVSPHKEYNIKSISNILEESYDENHEFKSALEISDIATENKNRTIKFIAYGGENEGNYRTTIFANHEPLLIDSNCNFIDHKIKKNEKASYEFEIDNKNLADTNILYAISIDLNNRMDSEQYEVETFKTNSVLFSEAE